MVESVQIHHVPGGLRENFGWAASTSVVNDVVEKFCGSLSRLCQITKVIRVLKSQRSHGQRASKVTTSWMQKTGKKKGKCL